MKKLLLIVLFFLSSALSAANYFSFKVNDIELVNGFDSVFVLKSSQKMNVFSDRIILDCQGFLSQLAFYNDRKNGDGSSPEELYDLDHFYCESMVMKIMDGLESNDAVCISLNIREYERPIVGSALCEEE